MWWVAGENHRKEVVEMFPWESVWVGGDGITAPAMQHYGGKRSEIELSFQNPELFGRESEQRIYFHILGIIYISLEIDYATKIFAQMKQVTFAVRA